MTRLFGSRELILGAATRRNLILAGVFADATDAVAGALAHKEGAVPLSTAALLTAPSVAAVAVGLAGVRGR